MRLQATAVVLMLVAAACTPQLGGKTSDKKDAATRPGPQVTDTLGTIPQPHRDDPDSVASHVLAPVDGFTVADTLPDTTHDLFIAIDSWLPSDLIVGQAEAVYADAHGAYVAVVSAIPDMAWRGDPGFVPDLIEALTGTEPESPASGVFTATVPGGTALQLWSNGDGFVIASSLDDDVAVAYLSALEDARQPIDVWASGDCLYLDAGEDFPYAPFPSEVVVPCSGAHNAEVLIGVTHGADDDVYDAEAIAYQRSYDCDKAYNAAFGDQATHAPNLITYMPDEDEWNRGDRYLACVVTIERNEGRETITGPMEDIDDIAFTPAIGDCMLRGLPADTVDCSTPHAYEFVGVATVAADTWPSRDSDTFDAACLPLLDTLEEGGARLGVLPVGLGPYAFENGDRTVRCMAFATVDGLAVDIIGDLTGTWRILGTGGVAT